MTKNEFLLKLIRQKEHWIYPMPKFDSIRQVIQLDSQGIYVGVVTIQVEQDQPFECYLSTLKGLVVPLQTMISSTHPNIEYRIETKGLKEGYVYDDLLFCYYPGGFHEIKITFQILEAGNNNSVEGIESEEIDFEHKRNSEEGNSNKGLERTHLPISYEYKPCYYFNDPVKIHFHNEFKEPIRILITCDDPLLTPMETEIFMKDEWIQEWFIRKNTFVKFIDNFLGKTPFKDINLTVYVDGGSKASQHIKLSICELEPYVTSQVISNRLELRKVLLQVYKFYLNTLLYPQSKKDWEYHLELMKACLNFNQQHTNNRLFYIWLLLEFGQRKEAKHEMDEMKRYEEYFLEHDDFHLISLMSAILQGDEKNLDMNHFVPANWLQTMAIARYTSLASNQYDYYEDLFNNGVRKSFLFAEVAGFLNKHPMPPRVSDRMYMTVLRWALSKNILSSNWLAKCERYYYQLEKNISMNSQIARLLYEVKPSKSFLRLLVTMLMREEEKSEESYLFFEMALRQDIYIKDLDKHYIEAGYFNGRQVDLGLIKSLGSLEEMPLLVKDYLYIQIIENRTKYPIFYRRIYGKIAEEYKSRQVFSASACKVLETVFSEWIEKRKTFFDYIVDRLDLILETSGNEGLVDKLVSYALLNKDEYGAKWLKQFVEVMGYEGLSSYLTYDQCLELFQVYALEECHRFMKSEDYRQRQAETEDPLVMILIDRPLEEIIRCFEQMPEEDNPLSDNQIKEAWYYHLSKSIVMDEKLVGNRILREMITYYVKVQYDWLYAGIYHMLHKTSQENIDFFHNMLDAHAIIEPSKLLNHRKSGMDYIEFYAHPDSQISLFYRYDEDETYRETYMEHLAFGMYVYPVKLYLDDTFEYYILVEKQGEKAYIASSDKIKFEYRNDLQDESSAEERINAALLAYQMNDEDSAVSIIEEQLAHDQLCKELIRF